MNLIMNWSKGKRNQRGSALFLLLIFAIPLIALAYGGLVVNPGRKLVMQRILQHQTDTAALSLGWECERHPDCEGLPPNDANIVSDWPVLVVNQPGLMFKSVALSLLQTLTMTQSAQAQEEECIYPDCFRGMRVVDGGRIYIEVEKNNDSIKAFSLAMIPSGPGAKPIIVD